MFGAKLLSIAAGAAIWAVLLALSTTALIAHAAADEFTDSLALMRRAMAGHWSGEITGTDANGEEFEVDDDFTFVVTSDDGLDSATWSTDTLEIAEYEEDGRYRIRNWHRTGRQGEIQYQLRIVEGPDISGNGGWVLELQQNASDGTVMETREYFELNENTLRMTIEMRPNGSNEQFETMVKGTWSRVSD